MLTYSQCEWIALKYECSLKFVKKDYIFQIGFCKRLRNYELPRTCCCKRGLEIQLSQFELDIVCYVGDFHC